MKQEMADPVIPIKNIGAVDKSGRRKRGKPKGRSLDPEIRREIEQLISGLPMKRDLLIEYLHLIQDHYRHIHSSHVVALADLMKLAPVEVYEVATFYHHFDVIKDDQTAPPKLTVRVCDSITCEMFGCDELIQNLDGKLGDVRVQRVPCVGRCAEAPIAVVDQFPIEHATADLVAETVSKDDRKCQVPADTVFMSQYADEGGYKLYDAVVAGEKSAESIIETLEHAGLRGLGGAGFPAGRKWRIVRDQPKSRLLAVNIDEGEPGTFKDRFYLERDPHRTLEGCLIAMKVVDIEECYIYIRDEYPHVIEIIQRCVDELKYRYGDDLPNFHIRRGAGAYICGEESAMIESIEGKRGLPRQRPPYIAQVGLFGRPTLEHNCETLHWVRDIVEKGADWFAGHGRRDCQGLRSFSVSGRVNNPGVHLAPAGISMVELIEEYCGGMLDGHQFYGYFPGGASGGILPARLGDLPLDFGTLEEHGCFIGSAAIIVLSDQDSAKVTALNAMKFFADESCGQCTPCRVGCEKAAGLMKPDENWDQELLDDLTDVMRDASICGLGQAAPNPMQCVFKYFPQELKREE